MPEHRASLTVEGDQPLIGVMLGQDDHDVTCYFTDEEAADAAVPASAVQEALSAIGAWSDLDWEEIEQGLDRIRHESEPTPPITDL